jgi:hypothetical protein
VESMVEAYERVYSAIFDKWVAKANGA